MYFKIKGTYFKIYGLYFLLSQGFDKQQLTQTHKKRRYLAVFQHVAAKIP